MSKVTFLMALLVFFISIQAQPLTTNEQTYIGISSDRNELVMKGAWDLNYLVAANKSFYFKIDLLDKLDTEDTNQNSSEIRCFRDQMKCFESLSIVEKSSNNLEVKNHLKTYYIYEWSNWEVKADRRSPDHKNVIEEISLEAKIGVISKNYFKFEELVYGFIYKEIQTKIEKF